MTYRAMRGVAMQRSRTLLDHVSLALLAVSLGVGLYFYAMSFEPELTAAEVARRAALGSVLTPTALVVVYFLNRLKKK
jgi:hypothetical protein